MNTVQGLPGSTSEAPAKHGYKVWFGDARLDFRPGVVHEPVVTAKDLILASGNVPADDFIVLQVLPSGELNELRLDETLDLRAPGVERFVIVRSDRSFRFVLEDERQEWPLARIDGRTLKRLGRKPTDEFLVFLKEPNGADREIADDETADLSHEGVEHFFFRPVTQLVHIEVNEKRVPISRGIHTGREIKQAAIAHGVSIQLDFVLSLHEAGGTTRVIGDEDPTAIHGGECFTAVADDDVS